MNKEETRFEEIMIDVFRELMRDTYPQIRESERIWQEKEKYPPKHTGQTAKRHKKMTMKAAGRERQTLPEGMTMTSTAITHPIRRGSQKSVEEEL